jgi:glycosyltransferase involved in cell wall biosynthesis
VTPLVSVGVPVRNGVPLIERTMCTMRSQTWTNLEILVSDNGSTDGTREVLARHAAEDSRVEVARIDPPTGAGDNFDSVLRRARGEYFMWASHDDDWDLDYVERLVALLESDPEAVMAAAVTDLVDEDGTILRTHAAVSELAVPDRLARIVAFIEQPESHGKANLMYALFRRASLAKMEHLSEFLAADPRRQDYHIILATLLEGSLVVDGGLRFRKLIPTPSRRSWPTRIIDGARYTKVAADWISAYPRVIEERVELGAAERVAIERATRASVRRYYRRRVRFVARTIVSGRRKGSS